MVRGPEIRDGLFHRLMSGRIISTVCREEGHGRGWAFPGIEPCSLFGLLLLSSELS